MSPTETQIKQIQEMNYKDGISVCKLSYEEHSKYGINWPGKGTKNVAETRQFIKKLQKSIKLATAINKRR